MEVSESVSSSKRVVRAFTKKVLLEKKLEEVEDEDIWDEMFEADRRARAKALRQKHTLDLIHRQKVSVTGMVEEEEENGGDGVRRNGGQIVQGLIGLCKNVDWLLLSVKQSLCRVWRKGMT